MSRILRVPFTGSVKLRSILLKTGPGDQTPLKVAVVSACASTATDQPTPHSLQTKTIWTLVTSPTRLLCKNLTSQRAEMLGSMPSSSRLQMSFTNMPTKLFPRTTKFANVSSVTLFFPEARGADTTRLYYVGFLGQWTEVRSSFCSI